MHVFLLLSTLTIACFIPYTIAQQKKPGKWYEGGTLHQVTIKEWKKATEENKLATCSDFVAKANKIADMKILLQKSVELRACINEGTIGLTSADSLKVSEVAAQCTIIFE